MLHKVVSKTGGPFCLACRHIKQGLNFYMAQIPTCAFFGRALERRCTFLCQQNHLVFTIEIEGGVESMRELFSTILAMAVVAFVLGIGLDSEPKHSQAHAAVTGAPAIN